MHMEALSLNHLHEGLIWMGQFKILNVYVLNGLMKDTHNCFIIGIIGVVLDFIDS